MVAELLGLPAPAKLNLFLHVVGRRADGYHLLQTAFRFIELCDFLDFERTDDGRIERLGPGLPGLAPEADLVVRAARSLQRATGVSYGARIACHKHIPAGGGLGGGSSDAATTLIALNRLWETGLDRAALMRLGLTLGADVPVFLFGRSAFAQGVGERLSALALPDETYWVLDPGQAVSTAAVFAASDLTRNSQSVKMLDFTEWLEGACGLFGRNDLEAVVYRQYPAVARLAHALRAQGLAVRMTGSGSCLFTPFTDGGGARLRSSQIIGKITRLPGVVVARSWVCQGLHDHPLRGWLVD